MPTLPQKIEVVTDTNGQPKTILIDGDEFPWYLTRKAEILVEQDAMPTITLTLAAVEIFMRDDVTKFVPADTQSIPIIDADDDPSASHD